MKVPPSRKSCSKHISGHVSHQSIATAPHPGNQMPPDENNCYSAAAAAPPPPPPPPPLGLVVVVVMVGSVRSRCS